MTNQTAELRDYIRAVRNRAWLVAIAVILGIGVVTWQFERRPERYSTSATVLVTAPVIAPGPSMLVAQDPRFQLAQSTVLNDVSQLVTSRAIASRVAQRLDLPGPAVVQNAIKAETVRGTSFLRVTAVAKTPEQATNLANAAAEEVITYFRETNRVSATEARQFVERQLAVARAQLEASERAIQAFKETRQMPSVAAATGQIVAQLAASRAALDAAVLARREADVRLATIKDQLARERPMMVTSRASVENPVFRQIQARLVDLEIQRAHLAQVYTAQHPRMDQIAREIAEIRKRLLAEARSITGEEVASSNPLHVRLVGDVVTAEVERAVTTARAEALQYVHRRLEGTASMLPSVETEFNRLIRENRVLESNEATLRARLQEMILRENLAGYFPASLQLVDAAAQPLRPVASTSVPLAAGAGGLLGLVLGVVAALYLETVDDRVRDAADAERALGVPVLAQIPLREPPRPAPAPATVFLIFVGILALAVSAGIIARSRVAVPKVVDQIRAVVARTVPWNSAVTPSTVNLGGPAQADYRAR